MHSSRNTLFLVSLLGLLLLGVPISSAFSGADFVDGYKSFVSKYISFFKNSPITGQVPYGGGDSTGAPQPCEINADCPVNYYCDWNGYCQLGGTSGSTSGSSSPASTNTGGGGINLHCDYTFDCPIGYYCGPDNTCNPYLCVGTSCPPNLNCVSGSCVMPACVSDTDHDGWCDNPARDNCPNRYNYDQSDIDSDTVGDVCDNCFDIANPDQRDSHRPPNGLGDVCDPVTDTDGDFVRDEDDNCPTTYNPGQEDTDGDLIGDACDPCPLIAGPCNLQCPVSTESLCEPECPLYPAEIADTDGDGFAWAGCFAQQTTCNQMVQCCTTISFTHCGDCDDVDDSIGRSSYPGAEEVCGDQADNDCDGSIDETCTGGSVEINEEDNNYLIIRNRNPRSALAREAFLMENLDLPALRKQVILIQEDLALTQATLKAVLAYLYVGDSTSPTTQSFARLQQELELRLAQGRSLVEKIDADESKDLLFEDAQRFATDVEQTTLALKDTLTRL